MALVWASAVALFDAWVATDLEIVVGVRWRRVVGRAAESLVVRHSLLCCNKRRHNCLEYEGGAIVVGFDIVISFLAADSDLQTSCVQRQHQQQGSRDLKTAHSAIIRIAGVGQFIYCYTVGNTNY